MKLQRHQKQLLAAGGASAVFWAVPYAAPVLYPLALLNTHIHELCHALLGVGTGGRIDHILVNADTSGVTPITGGNLFLAASAGYVGSAIVGGIMIAGSRTPKGAQKMLWAACGFLALSMILYVRGDGVGIASGIIWAGLFGLMAHKLKDDWKTLAGQFFGLQLCLTSVTAFAALFVINSRGGHSDAMILEDMTGVPGVVWASGWLLASLAAIYFALRRAWTIGRKNESAR
jgi:hypothetical protein